MRLLCLHVSEHRDESVVRPIWNQIFDEGVFTVVIFVMHSQDKLVLKEGAEPSTTADLIMARIVPLGKRFFPSESAFPLRTSYTLHFLFANG